MKKVISVIIVLLLLIILIFILKTSKKGKTIMQDTIKLTVNNEELTITLENNSTAQALLKKLAEKPLEVEAHDYGNFEKVGDLDFSLPTNDKFIKTSPGDVIIYQGNQITIYYDTNSYTFTKIGTIKNITKEKLLGILKEGDVTLTFSLK